MKGRDKITLQPSGAYAANLLGLSEQVPMKIVFLTNGPERKVQIGNQIIIFKHTSPRFMATAGRVSGLVIQALRHIGKKHVDTAIEARLRKNLTDEMYRDVVDKLHKRLTRYF